jgi:large subunit ribosomal protein L18
MRAQKRLAVTRERKRHRVRKKVLGTAERPRLSVFRSSKHIYAQMVDDINGVTLAAAGTSKKGASKGCTVQAATEVGKQLAEKAKAAGLSKAAFDRGHYKYHGRLKALADAVRAGGIQF